MGSRFGVEQGIEMPCIRAELASPLTSTEDSGIRVQVVGFPS